MNDRTLKKMRKLGKQAFCGVTEMSDAQSQSSWWGLVPAAFGESTRGYATFVTLLGTISKAIFVLAGDTREA